MAIVFDEVTGIVAPPAEMQEQAVRQSESEAEDGTPRPAVEAEQRAIRRLQRRLARLRAD